MARVPLNELPQFVRNVRAMLKLMSPKDSATTIWLKGNLGAGKTTFVQNLAKELEVEETVQSPTYVLMKSYELPNNRTQFGSKRRFTKLVHIDAYRLTSSKEFTALKPDTFLNEPQTLVCIEWPEHVADALPEPDITITFSAPTMAEMGEGAANLQERYIEAV